MATQGQGKTLPTGTQHAELLKKCVGEKVWLIMRENREFTGVLSGIDDYMSSNHSDIVLFQAVE